jgi:cardiolipin synthase
VKSLVQPGDGIAPLLKSIDGAKRSVEIVIFRFNLAELETALTKAAKRGVAVHALIANTNHGGGKNLRRLEMRLLAAGVTVARSADDLVRYHAKYVIIDRRVLYVLAFNFTRLDAEQSRSFGIVTTHRKTVQEAVKLFEADTRRQAYEPGLDSLVVSPANARKQLAEYIRCARKQLLIYDPKIADPAMIRLLEDRAKAGVEIKIIGRVTRKSALLDARKLPRMRLHTRTMVRDGRRLFIGSQSLRGMELDRRREVGLLFQDSKTAKRLIETFQSDWSLIEEAAREGAAEQITPVDKVAKKVAKAVTDEIPAVASVLEVTAPIDTNQVEQSVRRAVKMAVQEVVREAISEVQPK